MDSFTTTIDVFILQNPDIMRIPSKPEFDKQSTGLSIPVDYEHISNNTSYSYCVIA